ncbi:MAG TPA: hypothetical protein VMH30_10505 [Verrucomicrobiae bacterium]|nr:hypothetical protein [Verrucomicrobiae bacterium]
MKKICVAVFILTALFAARAQVLFSDGFDYPNGCIETDGLWYCYSPAVPYQDALVTNNLLVLRAGNEDAVAAPTNGIVNPDAPSVVYGSFTINVSKLPSETGGYFCEFMDPTNNNVAHIFIDTKNTVVPGTYRLGIANFATSINTTGATNFPMDLATNITYQVVFSWDETGNALGAWLWVNPSSANDQFVFGGDTTNNNYLSTMPVSTVGFSQYGGVQYIGNVKIGLNFSDVMTNLPELPVIGVEPQPATNYLGDNYTLYTAASGIDVTYQWLSNGVPLTDNGVTVVGSQSNVLNLTNLQATAGYSVAATTMAGSVTSAVAQVTVITTPTKPIFTSQPSDETNETSQAVTLTVSSVGTGPIGYEWFFEPVGSSTYGTASGSTAASTYSFTAAPGYAGSYYIVATNSAGSTTGAVFTVTIIPPPLVSISTLHQYLTNEDGYSIVANGQLFEVEGIVTQIGDILYGPAHDAGYTIFFIQDGTGGVTVFAESGWQAVPPVGTLVQVIAPIESYYGQIEIDPYLDGGTFTNLSANNPLPAPQPLNMALMATNPFGAYGTNIQCSLVSITNVYLSTSSSTYTAPAKNFPTNGTVTLYAWPSNAYYPGEITNFTVYVYTYTNAINLQNTNYFGQPIPGHCYEITGIIGLYSPTEAELYPTRYADFVSSPPAPFSTSVVMSNGVPTLAWPAVTGQTYSVYSATNVLGPWARAAFGLGYYPSIGAFTDTNVAAAKFYLLSSP